LEPFFLVSFVSDLSLFIMFVMFWVLWFNCSSGCSSRVGTEKDFGLFWASPTFTKVYLFLGPLVFEPRSLALLLLTCLCCIIPPFVCLVHRFVMGGSPSGVSDICLRISLLGCVVIENPNLSDVLKSFSLDGCSSFLSVYFIFFSLLSP